MLARQRSSFIAPTGVVYSSAAKGSGKSLDFRECGLQRINEMPAKDQRHACKA